MLEMEPRASDGTRSLAAAIYRHGRDAPEALAVCAEGRSLTYRQLAERAAHLARRLRAAPGWESGSGAEVRGERAPARVGILASRSVDACVAVVGTAWAGATYVPLGTKLPDERLLAILSACNPLAIVADEAGAARLNGRVLQAAPRCLLALGPEPPPTVGSAGIEWLDTATGPPALEEGELAAPAPVAAGDTAYIIFTSGTTGVPKGVMIPLGAALHYIDTATRLLALRPADRAMESCELTFDVSVHNMFTTWEAGASLHVLPAVRAMSAVRFARTHRLTVWNSVPSLAGLLRQVKALGPGVLPDLRLTVFGGEQLSWQTVQAWQSAAPASAIWNLYGPTETTVYCMAQPIAGQPPVLPGRDVVAIGAVLPGSEAVVLDTDLHPVAEGQPGELAIGGVQLASGYLGAPEQTAARFRTIDGRRWYLTGDRALRDPVGTFHWLGRLDNQVKLMGHRVELEEVDAHLRFVAGADLVGTVAWPISDGDAQGIVCFVAGCATDEAGIVAALKARLPPYMIPARVVHLDSMPLNANGKVDRKALRRRLEEEVA
jgi:amino acid adenylation domain-containing protein